MYCTTLSDFECTLYSPFGLYLCMLRWCQIKTVLAALYLPEAQELLYYIAYKTCTVWKNLAMRTEPAGHHMYQWFGSLSMFPPHPCIDAILIVSKISMSQFRSRNSEFVLSLFWRLCVCVCCFVLLNRYWGIVTVPGSIPYVSWPGVAGSSPFTLTTSLVIPVPSSSSSNGPRNYSVDNHGLVPWRLRRLGRSKVRSASLVRVLSDENDSSGTGSQGLSNRAPPTT